MTTPVGSVRITAEADAGNFGDDLVSVVKTAMREVLAGVISGMREVNSELGNVDGQGFERLGDDARTAARQMDGIEAAVQEVINQLDGLDGRDMAELSDAARTAAREVEQVGDAAREAGEEAEKAADKGSSAFEGMGEKAAAVAGGLAIGEIIGASIEKANIPGRLSIQLGLTADEAQRAAGVASAAFESGFGESLSSVTDATAAVSGNIAKIGTVSDETFQAMTESAILFAENMNIDVGEASKTAGLLIKNGLAKDGVEAFDLLTKAAQAVGPQLAQELPSLVDAYTIAFSDIGLSGEEAFNHFAVFADQGVEAMDKAGDSVKEFGIKMKTMDTAAGETLTKLGINADEAFAAFKKGGPEAQAQFEKVMAALRTSSDQTGDALALFGSPLEELGTDNIPKFIESLATSGGAMDGFAGTMDKARAANEGVSKSFSETLRTALGGVTDVLQPVIQLLADHPGIVQGATIAVLGLATAYGTFKAASAVKSGIEAVSGALDSQAGKWVLAQSKAVAYQAVAGAKAFGGMVASLAKATAEIGKQALGWVAATAKAVAYKTVQLAITAATKVATAVQAAFNLVMSLNPIGLIVIAIAALVAGLVLFFTKTEIGKQILEGFFNFLGSAWDAIKEAWSAAVDFIVGLFDGIVEGFGSVVDFFTELPGNIVEWLGDLGAKLGEWFGAAWDFFVNTIIGGYIDAFQFLWIELPGKIIGWLGDIGAKLGEWFSAGWELFKSGIGAVIDGISFIFTELPGKVIGWLGDIGSKISAWFSAGWELFKSGLGLVIDSVSDFFTGLPGKILGWLGDLGKLLVDAGKNVIDGLVNGLRNAGGAVKDFLIGLMSDAKDAVLSFFGIESPSKVFAEIGKNLMLGMAGGIDKNGAVVSDALTDVAEAVAGTDFAAPSLSLDAVAVDSAALGEGAAAGLDPAMFSAFGEQAQLTATEQVTPALTAITDGLTLTGDTAVSVTGEQINPALSLIGEQTQLLAEAMGTSIHDGMIPAAVALGEQIQRTQSEGIQPAFNAIQGGLQTVQGAFQTGVNAIGATWEQLRTKTDAPVRFTVDSVFNKGLVGVWNHVSDFIGTEKMSTFSYARGGTLPGYTPGRDVHRFISPTAGQLELSGGEAIMVPEFTAAMGPGWVEFVNRMARTRGVAAVRQFMTASTQKFQAGGVVQAPWEQLWSAVQRQFPGVFTLTSSVRSTADYHGQGKAIDVSNGTDDTPEMQRLSAWIYETFGKAALELIHSPFNFNVKNGQNVGDGMSFYGADTMAQHRNHVHWAAEGLAPGGLGPAYGAGFDMSGFVKDEAAKKWAEVEPEIKSFAESTAGLMASTPLKSYETVRAVTDAKIEELAKKFDVPAGVGVERYRSLVLSLLANYGHPASWADSTLRRMNQESGGNPEAVNNWDINAQNGTPSVGLMQVIGPTYQAWKDAKYDTGPYLHNVSTAAPANISASMRYAMNRYGSLPAGYDQAGGYWRGGVLPWGLFDTGGVVRPGSAAVNQSGQPERVLSPEQTQAFDNLVEWLTGGQLHIDWGNIESLIQTGIEVYQAESKKNRDQEKQTTEATQSLSKDLGAGGSVGAAIVDAANLSGDLLSVLDTSGLFDERTITLTAEEVRQRQIEEWQKFLDSLKAEHDKQASKSSDGKPAGTFDQGGMLFGPGLFASNTALPERILSPRQTEAFERLVAGITGPQLRVPSLRGLENIERRFGGGNVHASVTINEARTPRETSKAVNNGLLALIDR